MTTLFHTYELAFIELRRPRFFRRQLSAGGKRRLSFRPMAPAAASGNGLKEGIAEFYDESSGVWENIWGDHMHHGFYEADSSATLAGHRAAQIRMVEEALRFAGVSDDPLQKPKRIVDVGCGIGGSSRHLAKKYGAQVQGITLSPVQAKRAQELTMVEELADKVSFQVADALEQPFPDGQFDLVWSMESGEHMPDKEKFVRELARVAAPGAAIIVVTWCHRDLLPSEEELKPDEINLLNKICNAYYLPKWCSAADYVHIAKSLSLQDYATLILKMDLNVEIDECLFITLRYGGKWRQIKNEARHKYDGGKQRTIQIQKKFLTFHTLKTNVESICQWLKGHEFELLYHIYGTSPKKYTDITSDMDVIAMIAHSRISCRAEVLVVFLFIWK